MTTDATVLHSRVRGMVDRALAIRGVTIESFSNGEKIIEEIAQFFASEIWGKNTSLDSSHVMTLFDFARFSRPVEPYTPRHERTEYQRRH